MNTYQAEKVALAEQCAVEEIIPLMEFAVTDAAILDLYEKNGYTTEEWQVALAGTYDVSIEGNAFTKGLESFLTASEAMGAITSIGEVSSKVDDKEIIVYVDVNGELKNGQVELIFSNDYFADLKSCTLNVDATFEELMTKAALNTVLGMGSVFVVLILIMCIIQAFSIIPKLQNKYADKAEQKPVQKVEPVPAEAPVTEAETIEEVDNLALVAVIAAAIAAYEGKTSTDGFVVRSIKKSRRR